jgi:hypothetical protein
MRTDEQIESRKSNCLFFAVGRWWNCGGYIIIRKSKLGWFPHFLWSPDLQLFESYSPIGGGVARWLPPILFRGYIKHKPPHPDGT